MANVSEKRLEDNIIIKRKLGKVIKIKGIIYTMFSKGYTLYIILYSRSYSKYG